MGLKDFLKKQGFIEDDPVNNPQGQGSNSDNSSSSTSNIAPTFFPIQSLGGNAASNAGSSDPSFVVTPTQQNSNESNQLDPTFVKFFEDELVKANMPGPDYFEFRQQLIKTQQKMAAKGMVAPEVVLQAVIMNFETQDVTPAKLIETAKQYKTIVKQKNDDFLKGAATEKNNQLQKRQSVLQAHNLTITNLQQQIQQLEQQKQQLIESLNKETTQIDVDKSLGKEAIDKIGKAEHLISLAHDYIQSTIDADITRLQSV
jgi:hypothetical protein